MVGEDRTDVFSSGAAGEGGRQFHFEMNQERCWRGDEKRSRGRVFDCATSEGEDQRVAGGEADDGFMFSEPECGLALAGKKLRNGGAGFGFNYVVHIDEFPAETCGEQRADRALA